MRFFYYMLVLGLILTPLAALSQSAEHSDAGTRKLSERLRMIANAPPSPVPSTSPTSTASQNPRFSDVCKALGSLSPVDLNYIEKNHYLSVCSIIWLSQGPQRVYTVYTHPVP